MEAVEAVTAAVPKAVSGGTRSDYRRIAVWNTAFLGDAVLTLPLIQTLRRAFPAAEIDFYTRKGFAPLFASHPALHAVYEYDKRSSLPAMLCFGRDLRTRGYDLFICAHPSTRSAILTRLSGAGRRIGYHLTAGTGRTGGSGGVGGTSGQPGFGRLFFTDQVDRKFGSLPEIERLLRLTLPLGLDPLDWETWPELVLPDAAEEKAARLFAELRSDCEDTARGCSHRPVLGLHPGSVWGTKRWPLEYFAEIGLRALREGAQVLLFAGPGEESMAKDVQSLILAALPSASALPRTSSSSDVPELSSSLPAYASAKDVRLLNLAGALSLPELAACLGRLDCYLTNDSGPMHLAWAKGTPVVALFGPTVRDFGFAPRGESSVVLEVAGLDCRPCGLHGPQSCPEGHHNCMRKLSPDLVWDEVRKKIMGF
ncbi:MAG: glycosyltransferase family 9 protein [Deltaproteobacteria bacterium]|nr:glycosyltransferase family 9 protein [Deltaproteobacteria bacterium]